MLTTGFPTSLASLLALPYLATAAPYATVADAEPERANGGWKKFLWDNYLAGFLVTVLIIVSWPRAQ